jgi:hypothetical protein
MEGVAFGKNGCVSCFIHRCRGYQDVGHVTDGSGHQATIFQRRHLGSKSRRPSLGRAAGTGHQALATVNQLGKELLHV